MTVYGLMSDLHCHSWSSFASTDEEGRNTRLMHIIREIHRCCAELRARGGRNLVIAGDVFHTRGSVSPSVFNPLRDALEATVLARRSGVAGRRGLVHGALERSRSHA